MFTASGSQDHILAEGVKRLGYMLCSASSGKWVRFSFLVLQGPPLQDRASGRVTFQDPLCQHL